MREVILSITGDVIKTPALAKSSSQLAAEIESGHPDQHVTRILALRNEARFAGSRYDGAKRSPDCGHSTNEALN